MADLKKLLATTRLLEKKFRTDVPARDRYPRSRSAMGGPCRQLHQRRAGRGFTAGFARGGSPLSLAARPQAAAAPWLRVTPSDATSSSRSGRRAVGGDEDELQPNVEGDEEEAGFGANASRAATGDGMGPTRRRPCARGPEPRCLRRISSDSVSLKVVIHDLIPCN
ncbi:unnamed protein product [Miscanthus lutarioriparius]|uniref:Uncharacterized protein n=1 Tax=Miscanthus lutarioriparius TaxID=422564 RepID=A0A811Q2Y0_9POAL|nr:unnamed protein product [Miscanthus lutarioriparius]